MNNNFGSGGGWDNDDVSNLKLQIMNLRQRVEQLEQQVRKSQWESSIPPEPVPCMKPTFGEKPLDQFTTAWNFK